MIKPNLKPDDFLAFKGVMPVEPGSKVVRYIFDESGVERICTRDEARELVDSYPAKQRNCKIAFSDVRLKASVMAVTPTRVCGVMML